ncbi:MAG: YgfZ/GcvT domain-containing protein [Planctomycetota bacterium JB042]
MLEPSAEVAAALEGCAVLEPGADLLLLTGEDRVDLLQRISANDVKALTPGTWHWNCLTTAKGRLVDRVRILASDDSLLLLGTAGRGGAIEAWLDQYTITEDVQVEDVSGDLQLLHLVGPRAIEIARRFLDVDPRSLPAGGLAEATAAGDAVTVLRTEGNLADPGVLLVVPANDVDAVRGVAADAGATPLSAEAWDAVRVTVGLPRVGVDVTEDHHPLEAGLWDGVSFDKGCYVGQEVLARLRNYDKIQRRLVTLALGGEAEPGAELFADGKPVGTLTTVVSSPWLDAPRALGYVKTRTIQAEAALTVGEGGPGAKIDEVVRLGEGK